jgi:hypothetical protein
VPKHFGHSKVRESKPGLSGSMIRNAIISMHFGHRGFLIRSTNIFSRRQFLQKAAPKITLCGFHQPSHQIFRHSIESSVLIDFGVDRISEAICR